MSAIGLAATVADAEKRQQIKDRFAALRALVRDPNVWSESVILMAIERLRTDVMLELGEPPERLTITLETRWP